MASPTTVMLLTLNNVPNAVKLICSSGLWFRNFAPPMISHINVAAFLHAPDSAKLLTAEYCMPTFALSSRVDFFFSQSLYVYIPHYVKAFKHHCCTTHTQELHQTALHLHALVGNNNLGVSTWCCHIEVITSENYSGTLHHCSNDNGNKHFTYTFSRYYLWHNLQNILLRIFVRSSEISLEKTY